MIDSSKLTAFLVDLKTRYGIDRLTLSGGEPLLREDVVQLTYELKSAGFYITMDTTGLPLIKRLSTMERRELLSLIDRIGIPIDGSNNATIGLFRIGIHIHDINQILQTIFEYKKPDMKVCINTVVHKGNTHDLCAIQKYLSKYPLINEWQLFQYMPIGPGGIANKERYEISEGEFIKSYQQLQAVLRSSYNITAKSVTSRKNSYLLIETTGRIWKPKQSRASVWMDSDCNDRRIILGNITDESIQDIIATEMEVHEE